MTKTRHHDVYTAILTVAKQLEPLYGSSVEIDGVITFSLSNALFGAPNIFNGMSTPLCQYVPKPGPGRNTTWEHVWSRKISAITIIEQIRKNKSDAFLINLIKSRCRVAITLKTENQSLKPYQNDDVLSKKHPRQAYRAAGLNWVNWIGNRVYIIGEMTYNNREDILLDYNISPSQLSYRLSKIAKKWKDWSIERIG